MAASGSAVASARASSAARVGVVEVQILEAARWPGSTPGRRPRSDCTGRTTRGRRWSARGRRGSARPAGGRGRVVARLDFRDASAAIEVKRRRRLAIEELEAGDHPVVGGRDLLDLQGRSSRAPSPVRLVDRSGRALAVGDGLDQIAGPEGHVAAGEDAGRRGGERRRDRPGSPRPASARRRPPASGTRDRPAGRSRGCTRPPRA